MHILSTADSKHVNQGAPHVFSGGPYIMGVVNVTPDSFSDGGRFLCVDSAIEHGLKLVHEGAHILDIGGESTRPGAHPVDTAEEIERIIPVLKGLRGAAPWLSVDTRNATTMEAALAAGANIINDITALRHDVRSVAIAREAGVPVILMHMQGNPQFMQENPFYNNVLEDISKFFVERLHFCETNRIDPKCIVLDPGIGFGKLLEHNLSIIRNISKFCSFGFPVLLGASRKKFIAALSKDEPPEERIPGSLAALLWSYSQGVRLFRVHDVKETAQALTVYRALVEDASTPADSSFTDSSKWSGALPSG